MNILHIVHFFFQWQKYALFPTSEVMIIFPLYADNFHSNEIMLIFALQNMYNKKIPIDTRCGFRVAMEVMGGKWKPYIIYELLDDSKRPSELQRLIPGASERVLAQQLKELTEYGVVEKKVIDSVAKHTEYSLTDLGRSLIPIIEQLRDWGNDFRPKLEKILDGKKA